MAQNIHLKDFLNVSNVNNNINDIKLFNILTNKIDFEYNERFKRSVSFYNGDILELDIVLMEIATFFEKEITNIFINLYKTGNDYAPFHMDHYSCDACVISLGTTRNLCYRHNISKQEFVFELSSGDILFVPKRSNYEYKHSLLQNKKITTPRISILVFFAQ